jgi:SAM-dependent methyltransferase
VGHSRRRPLPVDHLAGANALAFSPGTFSKAVSICVLEHIPDDEGALKQMSNALQPGGRLVLSCDSLSNRAATASLRARHAERYAVRHFYTRGSLAALLLRAGFELRRAEFVLTTPVSFAIARATYVLDDVGRLSFGWLVKYPGLAVAGSAGLAISRLSELMAGRSNEGLTLIAEAAKA